MASAVNGWSPVTINTLMDAWQEKHAAQIGQATQRKQDSNPWPPAQRLGCRVVHEPCGTWRWLPSRRPWAGPQWPSTRQRSGHCRPAPHERILCSRCRHFYPKLARTHHHAHSHTHTHPLSLSCSEPGPRTRPHFVLVRLPHGDVAGINVKHNVLWGLEAQKGKAQHAAAGRTKAVVRLLCPPPPYTLVIKKDAFPWCGLRSGLPT